MFALSLLANGIKDERYIGFVASEEKWHCLMKRYQEHARKTRWQKLEIALQQQGLPASNTHRALADAQAAYSLLAHMASKYPGSAYETRQLERERKAAELAPASTPSVSPIALARETEIEDMAKR